MKTLRRDKLCILTFLLPIFFGLAVQLMGDFNFSSAAEPCFGVIREDLSAETLSWLMENGSVEIYDSRAELEAAVLEPSTQTAGVLSNGSGIKTFRSGDELQMYAAIADALPVLYAQRETAARCSRSILPASGGNDILKPLLIVITMVTAMFMGCTFNAMNILGEKEDGIVWINEILPMTGAQYIKQKIAAGFLGGVSSSVITAFICMRPSAGQMLPLLLLIILSAFIAALAGLFIAKFSNGLMVGIVYIKIVMILFLAPPILFYLLVPAGSMLHGLTYIFPSSAVFYGLMELLDGKTDLVKNLAALTIHGAVWPAVYVLVSAGRKRV